MPESVPPLSIKHYNRTFSANSG